MTKPKISVLIPTYNYSRYLPEAIESVLRQDWQDFEILISDDASTDGSADIIARYAAIDRRIRFKVHPANLGMVQNWNWCLSEARGEYIKYLFGDDILASPKALRRLVELLESNSSAVLAASARYVIDESSEIVEVWDEFKTPGFYRGRDAIARCMQENRNLIGEPSVVMFCRSDAGRGFDVTYRQIVDLEMWFALLQRGDFVYTPEPLCSFRRHGQQQTEMNKIHQRGELEAIRLFGGYYGKGYLEPLAFRKMLFRQIYDLRKKRHRNSENPQVKPEQTSLDTLGRFWYGLFWLRHRIFRPFENLQRWLKKRKQRRELNLSS